MHLNINNHILIVLQNCGALSLPTNENNEQWTWSEGENEASGEGANDLCNDGG